MICPKCGSNNCNFISKTKSSSGSFCDACCGMIIFGPIGLLCGFCDSSTSTKEYWVCNNCGRKFQSHEAGTYRANVNNVNSMNVNNNGVNQNALNITYKSVLPNPIPDEYDYIPTGNFLSDSFVSLNSKLVYFVKGEGIVGNSIAIRNMDTGEMTYVRANGAKNLFCDNESLYYVADEGGKLNYVYKIYRIKGDSDSSEILIDKRVSEMCYDGEKIYYVDNDIDKGSIYCADKNGKNIYRLCNCNAVNMVSYGDWLYFINKNTNNMIYSVNKTTGKTDIVISREKCKRFCISEGIVFYSIISVNEVYDVFAFNLINGEQVSLGEIGGDFINVHNKIIYYNDNGKVTKYNLVNGTRVQISNTNDVKRICIIGKLLFFGNNTEVKGLLNLENNKIGEM